MGSITDWLHLLAQIRALYDAAKFGADYSASLLKHRSDIKVYREAQRVSRIYHTNRPELRALGEDIDACRDRLSSQGTGEDRTMSLCRIFDRIKEGNGGTMPPIDNWRSIYADLGCGTNWTSGPHIIPFE